MPRKAAPKAASAKRMISWRESEDVYQTAVSLAEADGMNKQTAFSSYFRNGIALHDLLAEIRTYMKETREQEIEKLEQSKHEFSRKEAKGMRTMLSLYEPSDREVMEFIHIAARERMRGVRPTAEQPAEQGDEARPFFSKQPTFQGKPIEMTDGEPPIDDKTLVVEFGDLMGDKVRGRAGMPLAEPLLGEFVGVATEVDVIGGTDPIARLVGAPAGADPFSYRASPSFYILNGTVCFDLSFDDGKMTQSRLTTDEWQDGYQDQELTNVYDAETPTSIVVYGCDGAVRLTDGGVSCHRLPEKRDIERDRITISYADYTMILLAGSEELKVIHA